MNIVRLPLVALFVVLTSALAIGCAGSDASSEPAAEQAGAGEALTSASSSGLSQDLICAAAAAADDNSAGDGLKSIAEHDLEGDALRDFKAWQRGMASDYPSQALELPVKLGTKTYSFVMVMELNDGGGSIGVYKTDGSTVATEEASESGTADWSSPADKCSR